MKRGQSYNCFTDLDKPNHPIIKALNKRGITNVELIYASHWSSDAGWVIENRVPSNKMLRDYWWGFTIKSVIKNIEKAKFIQINGGIEHLTFSE